ncbi:MAG: hypothetical protein M3Y21_06640 [Candidatus Eremiobacteraeota bacterium]|nr:hypothetical protein [Candidatus Eremiobacteraeota bacterium]
MQIIRKNFGLKLLSLSLAIVGWAYFRYGSNPVIAARFDQQLSVPITTVRLAPDSIAKYGEKEAVVTIAARSGAPALKPDEIKAVLDLANRAPGIYNIPIQLVAPKVVIQSLSPASITLTIERIGQRRMPVSLHYVGAQVPGIIVSDAQTLPASVLVRGASDQLALATTIRLDLPIRGTAGTQDEMVRPIAVNSLGQILSDLAVTPNLIRVTVHLSSSTGNRH